MRKSLFWIVLICFVLVGCASQEIETNPNIPASAYAADGFTFYVAPPEHPEWEPVDFFFKDCAVELRGDHFSKTEYDCFYP